MNVGYCCLAITAVLALVLFIFREKKPEVPPEDLRRDVPPENSRRKPKSRGWYYSQTLGCMVEDMRSDEEMEADANEKRF